MLTPKAQEHLNLPLNPARAFPGCVLQAQQSAQAEFFQLGAVQLGINDQPGAAAGLVQPGQLHQAGQARSLLCFSQGFFSLSGLR